MRTFWNFVILVVLAGLAILLGIALGERGAWYFAWLLGTVVAVMVAAGAGVMLDAQDAIAAAEKSPERK
jgi:predicted outer membrane lipoprotein